MRRYVSDAALDELDALLRSDRPLKEKTERALELARGLDARSVCLWLMREIERYGEEGNAPVWLLAAGRIFPTEFLTAAYFCVLTELSGMDAGDSNSERSE